MKIFLVILTLLATQGAVSAIELENEAISAADINRARNVRDSAKAPNSILGDLAESAAKAVASDSESILVDFDVIAGFSTEGVDRVFSMEPARGNYAQVKINASKNGAFILKGSNASLGGDFVWNASWDKGRKYCSGVVKVSGLKRHLSIRVYKDCRDAGSHEY